MSYGYELLVKECESLEDAMKFALKVVDFCMEKENRKSLMKDKINCIPSIKYEHKFKKGSLISPSDEYWLLSLFNFNFMWYEDLKILAIQNFTDYSANNFAKDIIDFDAALCIQTYDEWGLDSLTCTSNPSLKFMKDIYDESKTLGKDEIIDRLLQINKEKFEEYIEDGVFDNRDIEEMRRFYIRNKMFLALDESHIESRRPSEVFKYISINGINNLESRNYLGLELQKIYDEWLEDHSDED